jgi:putative ABC transport system permease protein
VDYIQGLWKKFAPGFPFEYVMVDEDFKNMYSKDAGYEKIFSFAAAFSTLVACLGLFGLSSYMAEKRTKEIGIRKVLGAPLGKILVLFSKEFAAAVVLANLIAWPIGYYFMSGWLKNFAYRIDMGILIFVVSGLLAFLIAMLTVGFHSLKAAAANPVDALRYE